MLIHLRNVLNAEQLATARQLLQTAPWEDGRIGTGDQAVKVKNNLQLPHDCEASQRIGQLVLKGLDAHSTFFSAALPKRVFPPRLNRYGGDTPFYGPHVDGSIRYTPGSGQRVRSDVSCTVFLSEPGEYDGGELSIHDTYGVQQVKFAVGDAVLYPGTSIHEVRPVTRGYRHAAFFWVESMVRSDEQRRLLYEMDQHITALRQQHGDDEHTRGLTGCYHNLLRQWADT
jgi:PKHD-type hydroxylase